MARQSQETKLLRELAYCLHNKKSIPPTLLTELAEHNLHIWDGGVVAEVQQIQQEVYHNVYA